MAFKDMPQVDSASKYSDLSAVRLRNYLNQSNGFIAREDVPDKGCDFDVELILNEKDASNWRFALQLKSVQTLKLVEDGAFISYNFDTSRLGYLMRRIPALGMLAIYSVERDCIFFELVEQICQRLNDERGGDLWRDQDTVNVRIPVKNILSPESCGALHTLFANRFQSAQILFHSHGAKYNLPTTDLGIDVEYDLNGSTGIINALKKYGVAMLSTYDLEIVYAMVAKLSMHDINSAKELQIIAAVAHCEAGDHAEAGYYFDKLERRTDIEAHERPMMDFSKLKNDFALGKVDFDAFYNRCAALLSKDGKSLNDMTLVINLHYFRIASLQPLDDIPTDLFDEIVANFEIIENVEGDDKVKALLEIWNADNLSMLMGHFRSQAYNRARSAEAMGMPLSLEERRTEVMKQVGMETLLAQRMQRLKQVAEDTGNKLLHANIIQTFSRHRLSHELDLIAFRVQQVSTSDEERKNLINHHIDQAKMGFQLFYEAKWYKEAYHSLSYAIEFIVLATEYYQIAGDFSIDDLLAIQKQLEADLGFPPFLSAIRTFITRTNAEKEMVASTATYEHMSDEQIVYSAKLVLQRLGLPVERLPNVIEEMKAYRLFLQRCKDPSLEMLLYDPLRTPLNRYESPTRFVIKSKVTGIKTSASTDVETLLSHWSL